MTQDPTKSPAVSEREGNAVDPAYWLREIPDEVFRHIAESKDVGSCRRRVAIALNDARLAPAPKKVVREAGSGLPDYEAHARDRQAQALYFLEPLPSPAHQQWAPSYIAWDQLRDEERAIYYRRGDAVAKERALAQPKAKVLAEWSEPSIEMQAETYREMHRVATEELGYESILEALEAAPRAALAQPEAAGVCPACGKPFSDVSMMCNRHYASIWPEAARVGQESIEQHMHNMFELARQRNDALAEVDRLTQIETAARNVMVNTNGHWMHPEDMMCLRSALGMDDDGSDDMDGLGGATLAPRNANETGRDEALREALNKLILSADACSWSLNTSIMDADIENARAALATQPTAGSEEKP